MARIRSIKPDFFTSEVIASLELSARLTFIGLWTHCDDNGVCLDNPVLITAAIWPLDYGQAAEDVGRRTRDDLASLWQRDLIVRYSRDGRRYLFIKAWDEHQRVSHPSKPRYPRPDEAGCEVMTCRYPITPEGLARITPSSGDIRESLPRPSGESPATLRPEQGAGNREQGTGNGWHPQPSVFTKDRYE